MKIAPHFHPPRRAPLPPAHSAAEIARELGISVQRLTWALQHPDAPKPVRAHTPDYFDIKNRARYYAPAVRAWWKKQHA